MEGKLNLNINAHIGCLGKFSERYVPDGYFSEISFDKQLEIMSKIDGLTGLAVWYPGHPLIDKPERLAKKLADYNLRVADIGPDIWSDKKWKYGTLSSHDDKIRKEAIKVTKYTMDIAVELNAYSVLVWPAHDGFDYVFQADFKRGWDNLIDSLNEIGSYNKNVKIAIEYKQKDPRAKSYIEDMGKVMLLIKSLDVDNIGSALDLGHSFFANERPAESLALLDKYKKLYQIHLNDNYRDADPDLLFGTINFWDTLELFYWLSKTNYDGWLNIDTVTGRDDRGKMLELAVKLVKDYKKLADKLNKYSDIIDENLKNHNFVDNMKLIRELVFIEK